MCKIYIHPRVYFNLSKEVRNMERENHKLAGYSQIPNLSFMVIKTIFCLFGSHHPFTIENQFHVRAYI